MAANLGALEILGMAANGAQYGVATVHLYNEPTHLFNAASFALATVLIGGVNLGFWASTRPLVDELEEGDEARRSRAG